MKYLIAIMLAFVSTLSYGHALDYPNWTKVGERYYLVGSQAKEGEIGYNFIAHFGAPKSLFSVTAPAEKCTFKNEYRGTMSGGQIRMRADGKESAEIWANMNFYCVGPGFGVFDLVMNSQEYNLILGLFKMSNEYVEFGSGIKFNAKGFIKTVLHDGE